MRPEVLDALPRRPDLPVLRNGDRGNCGPRTCQPSVGFISSTDGGTTWDVQQLAGPFKNTWFPLTTSGYMVGEYIGISFVDGKAVPTFPVATEGTCELGETSSCNEWIASATIPLSLGT
jgi:hypothetical protein